MGSNLPNGWVVSCFGAEVDPLDELRLCDQEMLLLAHR